MKPKIETVELRLIGVQGIVDGRKDIGDQLMKLWERVFDKVKEIPSKTKPLRRIGYWHWIDRNLQCYFAGIEVDTIDSFGWDYDYGLASWNMGKTTFAVFREKNGQEGTITSGPGWEWLRTSDYRYDQRFLGDFEVNNDRLNESDYHEIWIPIVKKSG